MIRMLGGMGGGDGMKYSRLMLNAASGSGNTVGIDWCN